jgi:hypothetical protein
MWRPDIRAPFFFVPGEAVTAAAEIKLPMPRLFASVDC